MKKIEGLFVLLIAFAIVGLALVSVQAQGPDHEGPHGAPPTEIPLEISEAGASQEFVDVMCAMMKYHTAQFFDAMTGIETHFSELNNEFDWLNVDISAISQLKAEAQTKMDAFCASTPDNFGEKMTDFMNVLQGADGMESAMMGIGTQIQTQVEAKMGTMMPEMEALQQQMQNASSQEEAMVYAEQMTAIGAEAETLGARLEEVFGGMEAKMQAAMQGQDHSDLKQIAMQKQLDLFVKVFDFHKQKVLAAKAELEAQGFTITAMDEIIEWMDSKKTELQTLIDNDATDAEIEAFFQSMDQGPPENIQASIEEEIQSQMLGDFAASVDDIGPKIEKAIAQGKSAGLDVTALETKYEELGVLAAQMDEIESLPEGPAKMEQAIALIGPLKTKFDEVKAEYAKLQQEAQELLEQWLAENS